MMSRISRTLSLLLLEVLVGCPAPVRVEQAPKKAPDAPVFRKGLDDVEQAAKIYEGLPPEDRAEVLDELQRIEKDEVRAEIRQEASLPPPPPDLHKRRKSKKSMAPPTKEEAQQKLDKVIEDLDDVIDKLEEPKDRQL